ncbi:MAG: hypothetical protein P8Y65_06225 [Campylobacterales bacterium]
MYYETPNVMRYVNFVAVNRVYIIASYLLFVVLAVILYQPKILSSDALFWLKDSSELKKTESRNFQTHSLSKLTVHITAFDDETKQKLGALNEQLSVLDGVEKVSSLFSNDLGQTHKHSDDSEMVGIVNVGDLDAYRLKLLVKEVHNAYCNVVDKDFRTFRFFISSQKPIDISTLDIPGEYRYDTTVDEIDWQRNLTYLALIVLTMVLLFRLLFRNYISSVSALLVISLSTVFTFTLIYLTAGIDVMHLTMPFITVSIAMVDFLYFYYRWHVSQYKHDRKNALNRMLERSMAPALWTSVITALGLGSLVFIDSDIVRLLSLSVIFSSIVGYIINLTFLPALLSYFELEHTHVPYAKLGLLLASSELHYSKKFLYVFLGMTFALIALGGYMIYGKSNTFFELNVKNDQIELKIPYERIDMELIRSIDRFTEDLRGQFEDDLGEVTSLSSIVKSLNASNTQTDTLDEEALLQALFYLDLYGLSEKYVDGNGVNIRINLFDINKIELIDWLSHYEPLDIYFVDHETLLNSAKFSKTVLLMTSLLTALLIIGVITGWIFRSKAMVFVGFIVNAIPIAWFGLIVKLLGIPLSLEMLIAMTISVGLASDATIHFAYKYFRGRYFGRSRKHALEKMYFYAGIPVIIGSVILILMFAALSFAQVHTLQLIGTYSAMLIFISLLTDMFVLPVMLLFIDRFDQGKMFSGKSD